MAAKSGGSSREKRKRRKQAPQTSTESSGPIASRDIALTEVSVTRDTKFNPDIAKLFDDDWSGMQPPPQAKGKQQKTKRARDAQPSPLDATVDTSDLPELLADAANYKSKFPSLEELNQTPKRELSWAEQFQEGGLINALKAFTWFALLALVAWEVYLHSPLFTPPVKP
jgi:hypothetical protein